jgi:hypothetical protein
MTTDPDVLRIIEVLTFRAHPERLKKKRLQRWLESTEPNVIGAAVDAALRHWEFVEPALTRREVGDLLMKNFDVSLANGGEKVSTYAYNCHEAAKEFYRWVIASHSALPDREAEECLRVAKTFLEQKYRAGGEGQRNCIIAGAIEHLFEVDGLQEFFADWKNDADLSSAYVKANEWASWVKHRIRSIEQVALIVVAIFRSRGFEDVAIKRPSVGTTMPILVWRDEADNELAISCDEDWVEAMASNEIDVKRAANFAADRANWSHSPYAPMHFTVELHTETFRTSPR